MTVIHFPACRRGFPPSLVDLKSRLAASIQGLKPEQPGSLWPKTTIGCLQDRARLTPDQLQRLLDLSAAHSRAFASFSDACLEVDRAEVVVYQSRSLERSLSLQSVPLQGRPLPLDANLPSREQQSNVQRVMAEAEAADYWIDVSKDGNRRAHYDGAALGVTLVHYIVEQGGQCRGTAQPVLDAIRAFRAAVDGALPNLYHWFNDEALHVTLRALIN